MAETGTVAPPAGATGNASGVAQITPAELRRKLDAGEDMVLLDVRNEEEFADWKLEGRKPVQAINIPYFVFLENEDEHIARLPKDRELTVLCAKGGASEYIAEMLQKRGFKARNVQGGMLGWSELYAVTPAVPPAELPAGAIFHQVNRVAKGCLSYVLGAGGEAIVVDPLRHTDQYLRVAREAGLRITTIVDTHLHADHISGGRELRDKTGARYYLPPGDAGQVTFPYEPLVDGQRFRLGNGAIEAVAVHTPGHTPGSTCLFVNQKWLLTGDILFVGSIGRPDLGGKAEAWVHDLYRTIMQRFDHYGDDVRIFPAHYAGPDEFNPQGVVSATFGELRRRNDAMRKRPEDEFVDMVMKGMGPQPANFTDIRKVNGGYMQVDLAQATEMEIGPNRCAATGG